MPLAKTVCKNTHLKINKASEHSLGSFNIYCSHVQGICYWIGMNSIKKKHMEKYNQAAILIQEMQSPAEQWFQK